MLGSNKKLREIALNLQEGVPHENILGTIWNSVGDQILQEHLIDVHSIKKFQKKLNPQKIYLFKILQAP